METLALIGLIIIFTLTAINDYNLSKLNQRVIKLETVIEKAKLRGEIK